MKQMLVSYMRYQVWANERILSVVRELDQAQYEREIPSSFPSVYKTCLHLWDASAIWWQRMEGKKEIVVPSLSFHPTMAEIAQEMLELDQQWLQFTDQLDEARLEQNLHYATRKGDPFITPIKDILLHLVNHGTYHRGQLVTMLRQVGVESIPATDYVVYIRG